MLQSTLFPKTLREAPKDEVSINAILLIRAGFVNKLMAGAYTYLPLGLRVLKKIENIIRKEMELAGGQEILMPPLQPKERLHRGLFQKPKVGSGGSTIFSLNIT